MRKKKSTMFFIPYISGESFLLLALLIIFIPSIVMIYIIRILGVAIGPFIGPIINSYLSLILLPVILFIKPESLATNLGTQIKSEASIQAYFEDSLVKTTHMKYPYMSLIFAGIMLALIILYFYKKGIKKGVLGWVARSYFLNFLITIPFWGFISDNIFKNIDVSEYTSVHYEVIFAMMQNKVKYVFILLPIIAIVVTIIGNVLIMLTGKGYLERKQYWAKQKEEKKVEKLYKLNKSKNGEYY